MPVLKIALVFGEVVLISINVVYVMIILKMIVFKIVMVNGVVMQK